MDRRRFLTILSSTVAASGSAKVLAVHKVAALGTMKKAYTFFTHAESVFIGAAVARLVSADDLGPGDLEADVPYFIDLPGIHDELKFNRRLELFEDLSRSTITCRPRLHRRYFQ